MLVGYARVSTEDQRLDLQRDALTQAGCVKIYEEKISGVKAQRPALDRALAALRPGDIFTVWRLDRLGRSLRDLVNLLDLFDARGVQFRSLADCIDTTTPMGRLVYHVAGAMAEFERCLISERTRAGMQAARRSGRHIGRPRRVDH